MNNAQQDYVKYRKEYYSVWPTMGRVLFAMLLLYTSYVAFHALLNQDVSVKAQIKEIQCVGTK